MLDIEKFADTGQLFDNHYKLIRPLNTEGGTADVWLALDTTTVSDKGTLDKAPYLDDVELSEVGLLVAIKIYKPKNALDIEGERRFREEFVIVFNCNHANLIHPVYFSIFEETPYLVLPYCQRGSSELLIGSFVSDDDIWHYIHDVAAGLNYLHHCNPPIIHQDIKPANVLIDDSGNYAITDFGISAKRMKQYGNQPDDDDYEEQSGTFAYMAPERFLEDNIPSAESDIWAFGATLYELLTGHVPFGEDGGLVQSDDKVSLPFKGIKISKDLKLLICACLSKDPSKRPTAEQLLGIANKRKFNHTKKSNSIGKILVILAVLAVVIGLTGWYLMHPQRLTTEEHFQQALIWINASTLDSVEIGARKLDSLVQINYVPAMLELAKTIGPNYIDPANEQDISNLRKEYLKIATKKIDGIAWPTDADQISKSRRLFERILQLQDTTFKTENALAAYSMAKIHDRLSKEKEDLPGNTAIEILRYFNIAVEWSRLAHNQNLLNAFSQEKNALIDQVTKYYDGLIDYYYNYDLKDEEERYRHYKDAFLAAVNEKS